MNAFDCNKHWRISSSTKVAGYFGSFVLWWLDFCYNKICNLILKVHWPYSVWELYHWYDLWINFCICSLNSFMLSLMWLVRYYKALLKVNDCLSRCHFSSHCHHVCWNWNLVKPHGKMWAMVWSSFLYTGGKKVLTGICKNLFW